MSKGPYASAGWIMAVYIMAIDNEEGDRWYDTISQRVLSLLVSLLTSIDEERSLGYSLAATSWVEMAEIRRYQQRTYTSSLRKRERMQTYCVSEGESED